MIIAVEEVWNKFLLSPLEFGAFVDSFQSPSVRAYFDVGNVVISGYPQDWIRTLEKADRQASHQGISSLPGAKPSSFLQEGEIDWPAVHGALAGIGYRGSATIELPAGDRDYCAKSAAAAST